MLKKILDKLRKKKEVSKLSSPEAYRLWSEFYDNQPDNVVLNLEEKLFSEMISKINFKDKRVLDIGCGTGRHWKEILDQKPLELTGVDNSREMVDKLKKKFANADVFISENNSLKNFEEASFDIIISTLTIGHIKNIKDFFMEWNKALKIKGQIIITDFHPDAFSIGMKRSFVKDKKVIEVENYLYTLDYFKNIFADLGWKLISVNEKIIDNEVRHLFAKQNYIDAFNKYKGTSLILGLHLVK